MEKRIIRWAFYNKRQVYLFMVWEEDWYAGEVTYARVKFAFLDLWAIKRWHARYLEWANAPWDFGRK